MTEICLGKSLASTLWLQLNKKKQTIEIFAEKDKKKQKPFRNTPSEAPKRSSGGHYSKFFLEKDMGNHGKKYSTETTAKRLEEAVHSKVKINTKETFFNMLFPPISPIEDLRNVHP